MLKSGSDPKCCFICGDEGHFESKCPSKKSKKKERIKCHICHKNGHIASDCLFSHLNDLGESDQNRHPSSKVDKATQNNNRKNRGQKQTQTMTSGEMRREKTEAVQNIELPEINDEIQFIDADCDIQALSSHSIPSSIHTCLQNGIFGKTFPRGAFLGVIASITIPSLELSSMDHNLEPLESDDLILGISIAIQPPPQFLGYLEEAASYDSTVEELESMITENQLFHSRKLVGIGPLRVNFSSSEIIPETVIRHREDLIQIQVQLAARYNKAIIVHLNNNDSSLNDEGEPGPEVLIGKLQGIIESYASNNNQTQIIDTGDINITTTAKPRILMRYDVPLSENIIKLIHRSLSASDNNNNVFLAIDGRVTYQKQRMLHELVFDTPLDRIILESHSPHFPPKTVVEVGGADAWSHSGHILLTAQRISVLKNIDLNDCLSQCLQNVKNLYQLTV